MPSPTFMVRPVSLAPTPHAKLTATLAQLLAEMDGMDGNADVFVLGATNRPFDQGWG